MFRFFGLSAKQKSFTKYVYFLKIAAYCAKELYNYGHIHETLSLKFVKSV